MVGDILHNGAQFRLVLGFIYIVQKEHSVRARIVEVLLELLFEVLLHFWVLLQQSFLVRTPLQIRKHNRLVISVVGPTLVGQRYLVIVEG